jgi:hypothetical protein
MISTYRKDFPLKNGPNMPNFGKKIPPIARFLLLILVQI